MKTKPRIIALMNAYSQGKSGGDMVFIEIFKRIVNFDRVIVTSKLGQELCKNEGLFAHFYITSKETEFKNVILTYLKRTIKAIILKINVLDSDIFLGTSDFLPDVLPIYVLKLIHKKNKWVQHIFHIIPSSRKIPFYSQRMSFFLIKHKASTIVVDNALLKDELIHLGFSSSKIALNYPGINTNLLKSVQPNAKMKYDGVFMAQLRPSKGLFDLIEIWKLVCEKLPHARLAIIGKGEKRTEGNVDFLGYLEDMDAFQIIKSSTLFLFPSHEEGFGIAALQAQALGKPVVAWDLPVYKEIFTTGIVTVSEGDIDTFVKQTVHFLTSVASRRKLSQKAIENANRFEWDQTAYREAEIFEKKYES